MRIAVFAALLAVSLSAPLRADAQITFGVGGGVGAGARGGTASATHAQAFLQFKLPMLPGIRGDALLVDNPGVERPFAFSVNGVMSAPIPLITPYIIAGYGTYMGSDKTESGWNAGAGVRASFRFGVFLEYRRHQRVSRDLLTLGVTF